MNVLCSLNRPSKMYTMIAYICHVKLEVSILLPRWLLSSSSSSFYLCFSSHGAPFRDSCAHSLERTSSAVDHHRCQSRHTQIYSTSASPGTSTGLGRQQETKAATAGTATTTAGATGCCDCRTAPASGLYRYVCLLVRLFVYLSGCFLV